MTTMTDSEALAVLDRMLVQALAFRESSSKTDSTKSEQYTEDCKAFAHIAEVLRDREWRTIESAPQNRKVLLGYRNELGNWRTIGGVFYPENTLEIDEYAGCWDDFGDYAPAGWYESTETHEHVYRTCCEPTHWMPLPEPPK